jgi:hypothetical protein
MHYTSICFFIIFLIAALHTRLNAQETLPNGTLVVEVKNQMKPYVGTIKDENRDTIFLQLQDQEEVIAIPRSAIVRMDVALPQNNILVKDIQRMGNSRMRTPYLIQTANFEQKSGTWYYTNLYAGVNNIEYAFSKYFSVSAGSIPFVFLFSESEEVPVWLAPKVHFSISDKVHAGFLAAWGRGIYARTVSPNAPGLQIYSPSVTIGSPNKHVTIGIAGVKGRNTDEWVRLAILGGATSLNNRWMLMTENFAFWYAEESFFSGISTAGVRWVGQKLSINFGVFVAYDSEEIYTFPIPYIGFSFPFGRR